jgi:hypothetical protein
MTHCDSVIDWLLDSDPSIRWQVMRDLLDAPESEWAAERAKIETEGWGAKLLSYQDQDGQWAGGAFLPRDFDHREWQELGQPCITNASCGHSNNGRWRMQGCPMRNFVMPRKHG